MKIISEANKAVLKILSRFCKDSENLRLMHYVVEAPAEGGVLLYNLLTLELVYLTDAEYTNLTESDYLKSNWFLVPEDTNEKELADFVRFILRSQQQKTDGITGYTIFPTTDCNARCFYCFELGRSRIPMSEEVAHKVAQYIFEHCNGKKVNISWFGGEPLLNQSAIDIICTDLLESGVEFKSSAVSNGYLFDEETVQKAVSHWNLKRVQITLDGTEAVYNKIKAYVYKDTNAYQIVLDNIQRLLTAGVKIQIRLNMDLYNAEELLKLVNELAERFRGENNLIVYAHHIFDGNTPMAESHSYTEWDERDEAMRRLEECIERNGLASKGGVSKQWKLNHCMADNGHSVTILPDGNIGLCEHFSEDEFIGHIDSDTFDESVIENWKATSPEIPECADCFYYPQCIRLTKCANSRVCFPQSVKGRLRKIKHQMRNEYLRWLKKAESDETDDVTLC